MRKVINLPVLAIIFFLTSAIDVAAQVITNCPPSADAFIATSAPNTNYGANTKLIIGYDNGNWVVPAIGYGRILIKYDLAAIPSGATITSAKVMMYMWAWASNPTFYDFPITCFRVNQSWSEGTVTYNSRPTDITELGSSMFTEDGFRSWYLDITTLAQEWYLHSRINNGIMLVKGDAKTDARVGFYSKEAPQYPSPSWKYCLEVTYSLPDFRPVINSFNINNGDLSTTSRTVALNNSCTNSPTDYMASEDASFAGASWQAYSSAPSFMLSSGNGTKNIYFKVKNNYGESVLYSTDDIQLSESLYSLTIDVNNVADGLSFVPGTFGSVRLYGGGGAEVSGSPKQTDPDGIVTYMGLTAGTYTYEVRVNYTPANLGEEYWGSGSVAITTANRLVTHSRNMPYSGVSVLKDASTNEVISWGDLVASGRQIKVELPIINPVGGATATSYALVFLDTSRSLPADLQNQTGSHSIAAGSQATASTGTVTLNDPGDYYFGAQTKTNVSGTDTITDTSAFSDGLFIRVVTDQYFNLSDVRAQDGGAFSVYVRPTTLGDGFDKSMMMTMRDWSRISSVYITELGEIPSLAQTEASNRGWLDLIVDATYPVWFTSYMFDSREFTKGGELFFAPPIYRLGVLELAYGGLNPFDPSEREGLYTRYIMDAVSGRNIEYPTELQDVQIDTSTIHIEKLDQEVAAGLVSDLAKIAGDVKDQKVIDFINGLSSSIEKGHSVAGLFREYGRILYANPTLVNQLRIGTDILEIAGDLAHIGVSVENEATAEIAIRAYLNSSAVARRRLALLSEAYQYCCNNGLPNLDASLGVAISRVTAMIGTERAAWKVRLSALLNEATVANLLEYGHRLFEVVAELSTTDADACVSGQILVRMVRSLKENVNSPIFQGLSEEPALWGAVIDGAVTFVRLLSDTAEYYRNYASALTINEVFDRYDRYLPYQSGDIIDPAVVIKKKDAKFLLSYQAYRLIDLTVKKYAPSSGWEWVMWLEDFGVNLVTAAPTAGFSMVSPIVQGSMMAITQLQNWIYDDILNDAKDELQHIMDGYEVNRTADRNLRLFLETNYLSSGNTGPDIPDIPSAQLKIVPILDQSIEVGTTIAVQVRVDGLAAGDQASISYSGYVSGTGNQIVITPTLGDLGIRQITVHATSSQSGSDEYTFDVEVIPVVLLSEINVKQGSTNIPSGGSYDFGSLDMGSGSEILFTIENLGTGSLILSANPIIKIVGTNADQFIVELQPPSAIVPSTSAFFSIRFAPTSAGRKVASISIQNDDIDESWYDINFVGTGIAVDSEINIKQGATDLPTGATYNFGNKPIFTTTDVSFTIESTGAADLTLFGTPVLTIAGVDASQFAVQQQPSTPVAPGSSTSFVIRFYPTSIGPNTASVAISSNDPDEGVYEIGLQGVGINTLKNRIDFNRDGQEDILWRYYGPGGWNRAWFLGDSGQAGLPLTLAASQVTGAAENRQSKKLTSKMILSDPREIGIASDLKGKSEKAAREAGTSLMNSRDRRLAMVSDPRHAGGQYPKASPTMVADPRQVQLALTAEPSVGASMKLAAAPTFLGGGDVLSVSDLNWQIVGTGDFNTDTHVDILWRNISSGSNVVWFMNGTDWAGSAELLPVPDLNWKIVGTGDFNKDGRVDVLWRNGVSGSNVVWYMNGTQWIGSAELLGVSDTTWQIVGTGDFNKDGNVDVLWRYNGAGGYNVVWYLNNATWIGSAELIPVGDTTWTIAGTGDYNNDGNVDILWRYYGTGGAVYIWYLKGATWIGGEDLLPVADLLWRIVSR